LIPVRPGFKAISENDKKHTFADTLA
jgi:hypothetical protein